MLNKTYKSETDPNPKTPTNKPAKKIDEAVALSHFLLHTKSYCKRKITKHYMLILADVVTFKFLL